MGKPFNQELSKIKEVIEWSSTLETKGLSQFLLNETRHCIIVGSGGSISASYLAAELLQSRGKTCQVLTPFELYTNQAILPDTQVLLISASGKNKDIIFAFNTALSQEPHSIGCLTMNTNNPLSQLAADYAICESFAFAIPTLKDGFLATNSLIATWAILLRAIKQDETTLAVSPFDYSAAGLPQILFEEIDLRTLVVLYGKKSKAVAIDIESKCTEAALVAVQVADFRNFGHGRHHWLAKHGATSVVVALVTPDDKELSQATLSLIPDHVPRLLIETEKNESTGYLELLIKSFWLIERLGKLRQIDPGKPGIPEFGRRLYHLNPKKYLPLVHHSRKQLAIRRKIRRLSSDGSLFELIKPDVEKAFNQFMETIKMAYFGSLVVDYDGTIGSKTEKYSTLSDSIIQALITHLTNGFVLGIATGRGKSASLALREILPMNTWSRVLIGCYNGTVIHPLTEDLPDMSITDDPLLLQVTGYLHTLSHLDLQIEPRMYQVTIQTATDSQKAIVQNLLQSYLAINQITDLSLFTSGRCVDIIRSVNGSKLNIIAACKQLAADNQLFTNCLCVGDQGNFPGNDFTLLSTPYSLSVDEVSPQLDTCWNLAGLGQRNVSAMDEYLGALTYHSDHFEFTISV